MTMRVEIIGSGKVIQQFNAVYPTLRGNLEKATARAALKLLRHVKEDKLTGQTLQVRSGRLRRSISMRVEQNDTTTTGWVGTNVEYARRLEYGAQGTETVRAFMRRAPGGKKNSPRTVAVRSFTRKQNTKEYRFLRDSYADLRDQITTELQAAAGLTVRDIFGGSR